MVIVGGVPRCVDGLPVAVYLIVSQRDGDVFDGGFQGKTVR